MANSMLIAGMSVRRLPVWCTSSQAAAVRLIRQAKLRKPKEEQPSRPLGWREQMTRARAQHAINTRWERVRRVREAQSG